MQYLKFTHVDSVTGVSVFDAPAANGPVYPAVDGLVFVGAREGQFPTETPELFGTCPDGVNVEVPGVLAVLSEADFEVLRQDDLAALEAQRRVPWQITRLAFRNRFTMVEKAGLEMAGLDDPGAPMSQRQQAAMLRAYLADVAAATFIDLQRPDTRAGVEQLEALGLLAEGRAAEILDAPVQPAERPL